MHLNILTRTITSKNCKFRQQQQNLIDRTIAMCKVEHHKTLSNTQETKEMQTSIQTKEETKKTVAAAEDHPG
jgi:hypothetical protein